jgi:hypothetical protein
MFKPYTDEQLQSINKMLDRILADTYSPEGALKETFVLDTSWIERDVRRWCQQKGKESLQSGSAAIDVFRKRASVSAFRITALCYYLYLLEQDSKFQVSSNMNPETGDSPMNSETISIFQRRCRKIYNFMADYILKMLLRRWGRSFEDLQARRTSLTADSGRPKLIDRLPQAFSRDQLRALITEAKVATPDRILVSQWKANHWIEERDKFQYIKLI